MTGRDAGRDAEAWAMLSGLFEAAVLIPRTQRAAAGSLPLTVISGFLGAGKTTLLNRLLSEPHGRRLAVLVNDFGRIEIDAALIRSRGEDAIALTNGCACCSVSGDLTRTLVGLAQQEEPPEAIVLEASGLADPHGIVQIALANPALRLEGVLTLVDAETLSARLDDGACRETVVGQIVAADLLVLNKLDLVDGAARAAAATRLREVAPGRPVVEAVQSVLPIDVVLGLKSGRRSALAAAAGHAAAFESWAFESEAPLDRARVLALLDGLAPGVLRAKGFLALSDSPGVRSVYQRVGRRWSLAPGGEWPAAVRSQVVLIGTAGSLDAGAFGRGWAKCAYAPERFRDNLPRV